MSDPSFETTLQRIVLRCWADAEFKARLLADPAAVLQAQGVDVPADVQVRVAEDTAQRVHWVLPCRPASLSDEALEAVAGGQTLSVTVELEHRMAFLGSGSSALQFAKTRLPSQAAVVWSSANPFDQTGLDWSNTYSVYTR